MPRKFKILPMEFPEEGVYLVVWPFPSDAEAEKYRKPSTERAFPVLAPDFRVGIPKPPQAVRLHPAEERADDELLPGLEHERLPRPLAFRVPEVREESNRPCGFRPVEAIGEMWREFPSAVG